MLVERDHELSVIREALDATRTEPGRLIIVEGEAGIGKSSLLEWARGHARSRGMQVLAARGTELEHLHPYGVVASLFGGLLRHDQSKELLRGVAAPAGAIFEAPGSVTDGQPADRQATLHGLYWLTLNVGESGPLLITVDDAQWADEASLRFIAYLAHRLDAVPAVLLIAFRTVAVGPPGIGEQVRLHADALRLRPAPLSPSGVDTLVRTSGAAGAEAHASTLWKESGGNPFYVVELLRGSSGATPVDRTSLTQDVPEAIQASIRRRLAKGAELDRGVAEAIAILGDDADLERIAALVGAGTSEAADAIRRLTERAILEPERIAFIHPIVRTAVHDGIPPVLRPNLHRAAAGVLLASGASNLSVAGHLLEADPGQDLSFVEILRDAAHMAMSTGDPEDAVLFLARALIEPPSDELRGAVLLELARAETEIDAPRAIERYEQALDHLRGARERASARLAQGHALIRATRWTDAAKVFEAALADVDPADAELKSRLESGYISSAYVGLADHAEANRRLGHILAEPLTDPAQRELAAWSAFQQSLKIIGNAADVASLARRAVEGADMYELVRSSQVVEIAAGALLAAGRLDEELALLGEALDVAHRLNAHAKVGVYSYCRAIPLYLTGRLQDAIGDAETAVAVHELGWEVFYPGTCAVLAWAHLERGDLDAAARAVNIDDAQWSQRLDFQFMLQAARGRVALARGDLPGALRQYELAREAGDRMDVRSTHVLADWRTGCAVVLRALGRRGDAVRVAEEALELAGIWAEPIALGRASWALGIATGGREGIERLRHAVAHLEVGTAHLETARATGDLGAALRRDGQLVEARQLLGRAADLALRMGATAILDHARSELRAAGARPRRYSLTGVDSLTPSELRVARLVAEARTNREVAQTLFVTPKAVEYHLANAYRKLGITSRSELAVALGPAAEIAAV